jgi:manganese/zinc/iron transport system permease protein
MPSDWWTYNTLVVLAGVGLLGGAAGLVGTFAVLRRRALTGDALAHAALPGLCLAFLLVGRRELPVLLAGALVTGILGVALIAGLRRCTRIKEDAAIGIVLSVFFGAGVALSRLIQNWVPGGAKAGLDSYILGQTAGLSANDVLWIGGLAAGVGGVVLALYKEFQLIAFDPDFARVQGWPVFGLDLILSALIAVAVVIGLPAVGVVLMAALLIVPAVTGRLWAERLGTVLWLATLTGVGTGLVGTLVSAAQSRLPAGPVITLVGTAVFVVSLVLAPRRGLLARWWLNRRPLSAPDDEPPATIEPDGSTTR